MVIRSCPISRFAQDTVSAIVRLDKSSLTPASRFLVAREKKRARARSSCDKKRFTFFRGNWLVVPRKEDCAEAAITRPHPVPEKHLIFSVSMIVDAPLRKAAAQAHPMSLDLDPVRKRAALTLLLVPIRNTDDMEQLAVLVQRECALLLPLCRCEHFVKRSTADTPERIETLVALSATTVVFPRAQPPSPDNRSFDPAQRPKKEPQET